MNRSYTTPLIPKIYRHISMRVRRTLAGLFPGHLPALYSTLDAPYLKVPVQVAAYKLAVTKYLQPDDQVLDVGFGLGYGMEILASTAHEVRGIEVDHAAISHAKQLVCENQPVIKEVRYYDGETIPYENHIFNVVTCIDVIEHVPDYKNMLYEMVRVARRAVIISTPNRRPEYTRPDRRPKNHWHIREWSYDEFNTILDSLPGITVEWNFLNGPWEGPFTISPTVSDTTMALAPALFLSTPPKSDSNKSQVT
jgi:protein-L-isoaspartate O-methyltransferase